MLASCGRSAQELGGRSNPVVITFVPSMGADRVRLAADAIVQVLSEKTRLAVEAHLPSDYAGAVEALCDDKAHVGMLNPFGYIVAHQRGCADMALAAERFGSREYNGQIIARAGSGITSLADLRGHSFCRPDAYSASGWIMPAIMMQTAGVDPATELGTVTDSGDHLSVVQAIYRGECDAGATFVDARAEVADSLPDVNDVVLVIANTARIPTGGVSFNPEVPAEVRDSLISAFQDMSRSRDGRTMLVELYSWSGLTQADDSSYDSFRQILEAAGIDIQQVGQ